MSSVEEKLAKSLTAETTDLIPHLAYLLQDLWDLGSSPEDIIGMIQRHIRVSDKFKVLDLACGKGAVSVMIAKTLGCTVVGIDIMPEFIDYAKKKAQEYGVEKVCVFKVEDINEAVMTEKNYDIVILGSVGDVLGTQVETIQKLKNTVKNGGYIFIDDVYRNDSASISNDSVVIYPTRERWHSYIENAEVELVEERICEEDEMKSLNDSQQPYIVNRANELKERYPEKAYLFDSYIKSQQAECDELENEISGVTILLRA